MIVDIILKLSKKSVYEEVLIESVCLTLLPLHNTKNF